MNRHLLTLEPSILSLANIMRDINPDIDCIRIGSTFKQSYQLTTYLKNHY